MTLHHLITIIAAIRKHKWRVDLRTYDIGLSGIHEGTGAKLKY